MIKLCLQDYCQSCTAFEPISMESVAVGEDGSEEKVFEVRCSRWELCANVARISKRMSMEAGRGRAAEAADGFRPRSVEMNGLTVEVR